MLRRPVESALFTALGVENGVEDMKALAAPEAFTAFFQDAARPSNCTNFEPEVCKALGEVAVTGYPSEASIEYLRSNSVTSYMKDITVPTLLGQGQADTLFNLQESAATYTALKEQGTPVALEWQSWGHSDSSPVPGELDERQPATTYQGQQALAWFDYYVRGVGDAPAQDFQYFRDWEYAVAGDAAASYGQANSYPVGTQRIWYLSSEGPTGGALVLDPDDVATGESSYSSSAPIGPNYTETSALDQSEPVFDPTGSSIQFSTAALTDPMDVVGSARLSVQLSAPTVAGAGPVPGTQATGPAGQLVVFAKLYDVGPEGAIELPHRLISPVRVADATGPVTIELPAIVHRFERDHRLVVVLAGGDMAYRGSTAAQPVTLTTGGDYVHQLTVPVVN